MYLGRPGVAEVRRRGAETEGENQGEGEGDQGELSEGKGIPQEDVEEGEEGEEQGQDEAPGPPVPHEALAVEGQGPRGNQL